MTFIINYLQNKFSFERIEVIFFFIIQIFVKGPELKQENLIFHAW